MNRSRDRLRAAGMALTCLTLVLATSCAPPLGRPSKSVLRVAETTAPTTLDPQGSGIFNDRFAWQLSYQCLLTTTADGSVRPELATRYRKSADGLHYTFSLRPGVRFHNGEPLTSSDVVYTFDRLRHSPDGIDDQMFPTLADTVAVDDHTVRFDLRKPDAGFTNNMANPLVWGCAILSKRAGESENLAANMVGTGPWAQKSYRANSELDLDRFDGYWGERTKTPRLTVLYVPNPSTQVSNLQAGQVDLIFPDASGVDSLRGDGRVAVERAPTDSTIFMQINNMTKPFDDIRVRTALALALDRDRLARQAYRGATRPSGYLPPSAEWAPKPGQLPHSAPDIRKARQLLAEAGYPNGFATSLMYISGYDVGTDDLVAAIQSQLAEVGIRARLDPLERGAWGDRLSAADYALSWNAQSYYSNPYQYVQPAEGRQGPVPRALRQELDTAMHATSDAEYRRALVAVEKEEARTVYPTLTLLATDMFVAYDKSLTGVSVPPSQSRTFLAQVRHG
ncbi:ABC transporter substrate-binding protein [Sciscionella marina]|uniref:ABC transporter substrate-binding protein n=1 Tax=Sciscionella marina TaxID=508770 RepID=UPI0012F6ECE0|nr:ABC transporter substrate-binding protein [Sciscionella marina]